MAMNIRNTQFNDDNDTYKNNNENDNCYNNNRNSNNNTDKKQ